MHHLCQCFLTSSEKYRNKQKNLLMFAFSDALWIPPQVFAKWKIWQRYKIEERFMSIASIVVKLQIFKVLHTKSASMGAYSGSVFWPLLPQILVKFLTRCNIVVDKNRVSTIFEKFKFLRKNFDSECRLFVHFWDQFIPRKQKILQKSKTLA